MSRRQDLQSADGIVASYAPDGALFLVGHGAPSNGRVGASRGCIYLDLTNTAVYYNSGTPSSATWTNITGGLSTAQSNITALLAAANVVGVASGYKLARGQATTSTASDTVATGLATVVSAVASLDSDPTDDPFMCSCSIGDQAGSPVAGSILIKTWKNTGGTDPTPQAAGTFSKKVNWIAVGT